MSSSILSAMGVAALIFISTTSLCLTLWLGGGGRLSRLFGFIFPEVVQPLLNGCCLKIIHVWFLFCYPTLRGFGLVVFYIFRICANASFSIPWLIENMYDFLCAFHPTVRLSFPPSGVVLSPPSRRREGVEFVPRIFAMRWDVDVVSDWYNFSGLSFFPDVVFLRRSAESVLFFAAFCLWR